MTGKISVLLVSVSVVAFAQVVRADVEINNKPTSNMSCDGGVCTATAQKAVLNVSDLAGMLASGDVAVKTGLVAKDIDIDQPLEWTNPSRLTLDAQQSVTVNKQVTVAGQGTLTVTTNDTGGTRKTGDGEFIIVPEHGSVQFWDLGSSLIIDGNSYTLVDDIKTLASDIAANPSGFYALAKPYDASVDGTYTASPINTLFKGILEGAGNNISSLSILSGTNAALVALFSALDATAAVRHLGIQKATIQARNANGIGVLASNNLGRIVRCWTSGLISFSASIGAGGLVDENDGTIIDSYADVRLIGSQGIRTIGGLTELNYKTGTISSSFAARSIALRSSMEANIGGVVGENLGAVRDSFARNRLVAGSKDDGSVLGGVVGKNDAGAQIATSYAAGAISLKSNVQAGGLIGEDDNAPGSIQNTYWDLDMGISNPSQGAGNIPNDPGITGLTTAQLRSKLPKGFDPKVWGVDPKINNGFPYLLANAPK